MEIQDFSKSISKPKSHKKSSNIHKEGIANKLLNQAQVTTEDEIVSNSVWIVIGQNCLPGSIFLNLVKVIFKKLFKLVVIDYMRFHGACQSLSLRL